jgi:hypothetical protein
MIHLFRILSQRKHAILFCFSCLLLVAVFCTNFPAPFENIVANEKIRPFSVVCDPPEAAPGDTVSVRLYYYDPAGDRPAINWNIALDYGTDLRNNQFTNHIVSLDSMMLPGSAPDSFRFRVPDSVFFYSTQMSELINNKSINSAHLTIAAVDSLLRTAASVGVSTPQLLSLANNFSSKLKLIAKMRSTISLDVTMLLRIRYSDKFKSPEVNKNPVINWMGIVKVPIVNFTEIDSLSSYNPTLQYLYNRSHPDSVRDTVVIDSGYTYFVAADSGENQHQIYRYLSLSDNSEQVDTEQYNYSWFYTNLDYSDGMIMDSLLIFGGGRSGSVRTLLPPVDVAMHRFALYLVVRDSRGGDAGATPGEAFGQANGYFIYTDAYTRNSAHKQTTRRGG